MEDKEAGISFNEGNFMGKIFRISKTNYFSSMKADLFVADFCIIVLDKF